tara:strand:+ start:160 stop:534 length:375 start_codon:yes stop_codon:yes gene_type:complete
MRIWKKVKFLYLALIFCYSPIDKVNATTPRSLTCTSTEYKEEYIPGTNSKPGYVKSYEVDLVIPCPGERYAEEIDDNDCSQGSFIGSVLGAGIALSSSRGNDRFWSVPIAGTAGALIGCQLDGG